MARLKLPQPYDFGLSTERFRAFGPDLANLRNAKNLLDLLKAARPNDRRPSYCLNQVGIPKRPEIKPADFAKAVAPVFKKYCISCHGAQKPRAGLSLTRFKTDKEFLR